MDENFFKQPAQNPLGDPGASIDEWDKYRETKEDLPKAEPGPFDDSPVHDSEIAELKDEHSRIDESAVEAKEDFPVKWFKTEKDSIYTYDNNGKTSRFKTAEGKQYEQQNVTAFVDLNPKETEEFLDDMNIENIGVYVVEELPNGDPHIIKDIAEVQDPEKIYLASLNIDKKRWVRKKKASLKPIIGYTPFDTRMYEKDGKLAVDVHLGHKIVEIETTQEEIAEPTDEEFFFKDAPQESKENQKEKEEAPKQKVEKESGELKIDKTRLENMLGSARGLVGVLRKRENEGFGQLLGEGELSLLRSAISEGEELLDKEIIAKEEFEDMIIKMTSTIGEMGDVPMRRGARDSADSLREAVSRIGRMTDDAHEMGVSIAKTEGRSELTLSLIKRLEGTLDVKQLFVKKLHGRLSEYMGR